MGASVRNYLNNNTKISVRGWKGISNFHLQPSERHTDHRGPTHEIVLRKYCTTSVLLTNRKLAVKFLWNNSANVKILRTN
jgi:hypothetical protein